MLSIDSILQSLPSLLMTSIIASFPGFASYFLIRAFSLKAPNAADFAGVYFFFLGLVITMIVSFPLKLPFILTFLLLWPLATKAERVIHQRRDYYAADTLSRFSLTVGTSYFLGFICLIVMSEVLAGMTPLRISPSGYVIGASISPFAPPIFRWLWQSLQLRPGFDRHFEEAEGGYRS